MRIAAFLCVALLISGLPFAVHSASALKKIGETCTKNSECESNDCEDSSLDGADNFCDCFNDNDCSVEYGPGSWECEDGTDKSYDLDYCQNGADTRYPIAPKGASETGSPGFWSHLTDPAGSISQQELNQVVNAPQLRIKIPGVSFSTPEQVKANTKESVGPDGRLGTFMFIPFIGEYLATVYRYAVITASIIAVIIIIIQGVIITGSAGSADTISHAKERLAQAVTGLLIAVSSYVILYTINPELVQFRNLKVLQVRELAYPEPEDYTGNYPKPGDPKAICTTVATCKPICLDRTKWPTLVAEGIAHESQTVRLDTLKLTGIKAQSGARALPSLVEPLKKAGLLADQAGYRLFVSTGFRSLPRQLDLACDSILAGEKSISVAWPGGSNHGGGSAVDIYLQTKDGKPLSAPAIMKLQDKLIYRPHNRKLAEIMYAAGWKRLKFEVWHFEYPATPIESTRTTNCFETAC